MRPASERFQVRTVSGYRAPNTGGDSPLGLSAMVLDSWAGWRVVAQHRSEDHAPHGVGTAWKRVGRRGAVEAAEADAARLNA